MKTIPTIERSDTCYGVKLQLSKQEELLDLYTDIKSIANRLKYIFEYETLTEENYIDLDQELRAHWDNICKFVGIVNENI